MVTNNLNLGLAGPGPAHRRLSVGGAGLASAVTVTTSWHNFKFTRHLSRARHSEPRRFIQNSLQSSRLGSEAIEISVSSSNSFNYCNNEANSMVIKKSNYEVIIAVTSFGMDQLAKLCSDEPMLVSDVLDTFCVQGRQRIESLDAAIQSQNLPDAIFDAVSLI